MRVSPLFLLLVLIALGSCKSERFTSKDAGFSIDFPGIPQEMVQEVENDFGKCKLTMFEYSAGGGDINYTVSVSDPVNSVFSNPDEILMDVAHALETKAGITTSPAVLGERNGNKTLRIALEHKKTHADYLLVLKGKKLYQIGFLSPDNLGKKGEINRFFDSFQLL
jgi:hypothetical protein